jgi:hypothetical protein
MSSAAQGVVLIGPNGESMDAAALDALDAESRMGQLGNALYPCIRDYAGEALAGKLTGMLLELPTADVLGLLGSPDALNGAVKSAVAVLPAEMQALMPKPVPTPHSPMRFGNSPTSVLAGPDRWADEEDDGCEPLPSIGAMLESAEVKRSASGAQPMDTEDPGFACEWDSGMMAALPSEKLSEWIATRLSEPQVRIPRAVVEVMGASVALDLLAATERVQAGGGMLVEETGKPRTSGGIFLKLLREATHLDATAQAAATLRIKTEGVEAKKSQQKALAAKRRVGGHSPQKATTPKATPAQAAPSHGPPKPALGDFMASALSRQISA